MAVSTLKILSFLAGQLGLCCGLASAQTAAIPAPPQLAPSSPAVAAKVSPAANPPLPDELAPLPKDPTARAIENTRRILRKRSQANNSAAPHSAGVVVITGNQTSNQPSTAERIEATLNPRTDGVAITTNPGVLSWQECLNACVGPACCITVERDPAPWKKSALR